MPNTLLRRGRIFPQIHERLLSLWGSSFVAATVSGGIFPALGTPTAAQRVPTPALKDRGWQRAAAASQVAGMAIKLRCRSHLVRSFSLRLASRKRTMFSVL